MSDLKKEFRGRDDETMEVAELKKVEQEEKKVEKFVQKFKRAARESEYKERPLIEEFKRGMNRTIRRKLIEVERPSRSIEQWFERITNLDTHWRESR